MGGNPLQFWASIFSHLAMFGGMGLIAVGFVMIVFGLVLRWL